jgi:DNA-binding MarR family transcriptional regulator
MIEIVGGTIDEQIIIILQKQYPVTVEDLESQLKLSRKSIVRVLHQFEIKGIVLLEPLPNKTYIRLLRHDIKIVRKQRQRRFIKHHRRGKPVKLNHDEDHDEMMYG